MTPSHDNSPVTELPSRELGGHAGIGCAARTKSKGETRS